MTQKIPLTLAVRISTISISFVWLINGLFCKVLNFAPRHELIVVRLIGEEYGTSTTKIIGSLEIIMAIWVLSRFKATWRTYLQVLIVAVMNIIEFLFVPDLLLFGRLNLFFAFVFISVVYWNYSYSPKIPTL